MIFGSRSRTHRPLGLYVTHYGDPRLSAWVNAYYGQAAVYMINMQVRQPRVFMDLYYEELRSDFLDGIVNLSRHERKIMRFRLLGIRKFRNDYRRECREFDSRHEGFVSII